MKLSAAVTLALATLATSHSALSESNFNPAQPVLTELKDGVYQYSQFFYNSLVVVTDEGVIITDPSNEIRAKAMLSLIHI